MLSQLREERNFHLTDEQVTDIFNAVDAFVSHLVATHPQFMPQDAEDIRKAVKQV